MTTPVHVSENVIRSCREISSRSSTNILATVQKQLDIVPHFLAAHALAGAAASFGISKTDVLKGVYGS